MIAARRLHGSYAWNIGETQRFPNRKNPFGHPSSFGAPGTGGSFAFVDPHAQLGYAYFPNRMELALADPRELALRTAVYQSIGEPDPYGLRTRPRRRWGWQKTTVPSTP